jgi:hypothetical protein
MLRFRALLCALVLTVAYSSATSAQTLQLPAFDLSAAPAVFADEGIGQFRPRPVPNSLPHVGLGLKVGTLGVGFQVGTALASRVNVRGGANFFNYNDSISEHGVLYNGTLQLRSVEAKLDLFVVSGFRVTPGVLLYNNNGITATASATAGQSFTLGGVRYDSYSNDPLKGGASLTMNKFAPTLGIGFGNLLPRSFRHWSLSTDLGVVFQGSPQFGLSLSGSACVTGASGAICQPIAALPGASQNIESERLKIQNDLKPFKYYPEVSIMFGYKL